MLAGEYAEWAALAAALALHPDAANQDPLGEDVALEVDEDLPWPGLVWAWLEAKQARF